MQPNALIGVNITWVRYFLVLCLLGIVFALFQFNDFQPKAGISSNLVKQTLVEVFDYPGSLKQTIKSMPRLISYNASGISRDQVSVTHEKLRHLEKGNSVRYRRHSIPFIIDDIKAHHVNKLLNSTTPVLDKVDFEKFPIATGASSNHFRESLAMLNDVQNELRGHPIHYFDLGLNSSEISEVCILSYA